MSDLRSFLEAFAEKEDLLDIASAVGGRVVKVRTDVSGKGLELELDLEGRAVESAALCRLEELLRATLCVSHVRLFLRNIAAKEDGSPELSSFFAWICACVKKENPLYRGLLSGLDLEESGLCVRGCRNFSLDTQLENAFAESFERFVSAYLFCKFEFVWRFDDGDSTDTLEDILQKHNEKLMRSAAEILTSLPDTPPSPVAAPSAAKTEFKTGEKKGRKSAAAFSAAKAPDDTGAQDASLPPDPDSWVSKAKAVGAENKSVFKPTAQMDGVLWGRMNPAVPLMKIEEFAADTGLVQFEGMVEHDESKLTKAGNKVIVSFYVSDETACVSCVCFMKPEEADNFEKYFKKGGYARFQASVLYDGQFAKDIRATVEGMMEAKAPPQRTDNAPVKRVELHCHSKMSEKDAVSDVERIFKFAASLGHPACALTDHGVVQGFPEMAETCLKLNNKSKEENIKPIFGLEGYLIDDGPCVAFGDRDDDSFEEGFVSVALETTGRDCSVDGIVEIHAVRFVRSEDGGFEETESYSTLVNPEVHIPDSVSERLGITAYHLLEEPKALDAVKALSAFVGELPICGQDILLILSFLRTVGFSVDVEKHEDYRVKFLQTAVDLSRLSEYFFPEVADRSVAGLASSMGLAVDYAQGVKAEANNSGRALGRFLHERGILTPEALNSLAGKQELSEVLAHKRRPFHIILLAQNQLGLYNMYHMVSLSHTKFFHNRPRLPRSVLEYYRTGLIIGSACERGDMFVATHKLYVDNGNDYERTFAAMVEDEAVRKIARFYDYLEVQPICNNMFYLRNPESGLKIEGDLVNLNKLIVAFGDRLGIMSCATTDSHFIEKNEGEYRRYLLKDMGFKDADDQPDLYFRTTEEMLSEFSYLGAEKATEVVVTNTNAVAARVQFGMKPFPDGTYPPIIATAAGDIEKLTWDAAMELYGYQGVVAPIVQARVEKELKSIIGNGFAIMYYIAYRLVKKSNEDGYVVGSRGSVGSSLVATLCGISEVNPLEPHYRCPSCKFSIFNESGRYGSGYDMPPMVCPECGKEMKRDGQDIPFETFLGFFGDKQPDIDLNFSGEYQARAHKYVEELFGKSHTFRAGTISSYADKNAIAVVNKIVEGNGDIVSRAERRRRSLGLIGVKRTTGQHPGGIVVVPKEMDIHEFTPYQRPANKASSETITTHFDFNAMHDTILKLDILGHFDPTMLRMLSDLTGIDVRTIPIPDEKVMSLFVSMEALGIPEGASEAGAATLGLSEMGTFMARDMIAETQPKQFYDLVQLMGLSHGTDVWKGNAQDLIRDGTCTLDSVIGCRDGIMTRLIHWGLPNKEAFDIMEKVRKGKGLSPEQEALMVENNVPDWYIASCKKIKYMFPKAHAAAYAISSLRVAWFKVYYPEEYYCTFFTIRGDEFNGDHMCHALETVRKRRKFLYQDFLNRTATEKSEYYLCELVEEMYLRGISFLPYDIENSHSHVFRKVEKGRILPPLNAIPTISQAMGQSVMAAREAGGPFKNKDELARRSALGPVAMEKLKESGCISHLPDSAQIDLFSLFE